jgi:hypothetical protein
MRRGRRIAVCAASIGLAAAVWFCPEQPPAVETGPWLELIVDASESLAVANGRSEVMDSLETGTISLWAAVERCLDLERQHPDACHTLHQAIDNHWDGDTYTEKLARNLVSIVQNRWRDDPRGATVLDRLNADLGAAFVKPLH